MQPLQPLKMAHWREIYFELFLQNHSTYSFFGIMLNYVLISWCPYLFSCLSIENLWRTLYSGRTYSIVIQKLWNLMGWVNIYILCITLRERRYFVNASYRKIKISLPLCWDTYPCSVLRIRDVYPGSWFYPSQIPDLRSRIPDPKTAIKDRGEKKSLVIPFIWSHKVH